MVSQVAAQIEVGTSQPLAADVVSSRTASLLEPSPYLLSRHADWLMIGGASILFFACCWMFVDKGASTSQISWTAFYLAMIVNHPHFMASYFLLYWDKRAELLSKKSYLWAGIIAPVILLGYIGYALMQPTNTLLSYAINFMYFIVGWHYVKQIYGTTIVTAAKGKFFLSKGEAWALRLNMYPVWFMSWLNGNGMLRSLDHYGVGYQTLAIPQMARWINFGLVGLSAAFLAGMLLRKYIREGKTPPFSSVVSVLAIYVWYIPSFYHPHFFYMIPFFHSLQYLLFVVAMKRNEFRSLAFSQGSTPQEARTKFLFRGVGYAAVLFLTGMFFFNWGPNYLDRNYAYDEHVFGAQIFMFLFITFINIHHYFIDNVIWKRDNPALKLYL